MRRLEELLRQMCQAAKAIGNTELENKFAEGLLIANIAIDTSESTNKQLFIEVEYDIEIYITVEVCVKEVSHG